MHVESFLKWPKNSLWLPLPRPQRRFLIQWALNKRADVAFPVWSAITMDIHPSAFNEDDVSINDQRSCLGGGSSKELRSVYWSS